MSENLPPTVRWVKEEKVWLIEVAWNAGGVKAIKTLWNKYGRKKWKVQELDAAIKTALTEGLEVAKEKRGMLRYFTNPYSPPNKLTPDDVKRILEGESAEGVEI